METVWRWCMFKMALLSRAVNNSDLETPSRQASICMDYAVRNCAQVPVNITLMNVHVNNVVKSSLWINF